MNHLTNCSPGSSAPVRTAGIQWENLYLAQHGALNYHTLSLVKYLAEYIFDFDPAD